MQFDIEVSRLYSSGMCMREVAEKLNCSQKRVWNALKRTNTSTRDVSRSQIKWSLRQEQYAVDKYQSGSTLKGIAIQLQCSAPTVAKILKRNKVSIRSNSESHKIDNIQIPKFPNPETEYWLGFILGDGCILDNGTRSKRLVVNLQLSDKKHLEKIRKWLGSSLEVKEYPQYNRATLKITSEELCKWLISFGIVPRKSKVATVDPRLQNSRHFWRGVIDADGNIGQYKDRRWLSWKLSICGTKLICEAFRAYLCSLDISYSSNHIYTRPHISILSLSGKKAVHAIQHFYKDGVALDRKQFVANMSFKNDARNCNVGT